MNLRPQPSPRFAIVARSITSTNRGLLQAAATLGLGALVVSPDSRRHLLQPGDVALGRLDVLPTLDGPEPGLGALRSLEERGVLVLNRAGALLAAHDKLMTAIKLAAHGLPHPRTAHSDAATELPFEFPVVVKPRFGSWGRDVTVCWNRLALERCLHRLGRRGWFRRQGVLLQEFVQPQGFDLRVLVARGEIVGAVKRVAASGEWRTNIALGGRRIPVDPPPQACLIALGAAAALGTDLVGVDLLPEGNGRWVVIELNGAVDFTPEYSLDGQDVFERAVKVLARAGRGDTESSNGRVRALSRERLRGPASAYAEGEGGAR